MSGLADSQSLQDSCCALQARLPFENPTQRQTLVQHALDVLPELWIICIHT